MTSETRIQAGKHFYGSTDVQVGSLLRINASHFYRDEQFLVLINRTWAKNPDGHQVPATWHCPETEPDEFSDLFLHCDFHGAGREGGMVEGDFWDDLPKWIQTEILELANRFAFEDGIVWISNLGDPAEYEEPASES